MLVPEISEVEGFMRRSSELSSYGIDELHGFEVGRLSSDGGRQDKPVGGTAALKALVS
ncbi:MAG: hypothetical protein QOJ16_1201 [Acidobacteriota bacterium]|jgi:hypothetical protein|nr:hypothetical protein [Acidobacteriota bacterium]